MRLDLYLVKTGAFESRSKAAAAISDGRVSVNGKACVKASFGVKDDDSIEIIPCVSDGYVGRAAIKLEYALQNFKISVDGLSAVDIHACCQLRRDLVVTDCLESATIGGVDEQDDEQHAY